MDERWEKRFQRIRVLGGFAVLGLLFAFTAWLTSDFVRTLCIVAALIFELPVFVYTDTIVILHWKDRYRGKHSDLSGALILIETSGWMKIVYLFRHLIPDMRHSGRYGATGESISSAGQSQAV